ncbi:MAG: outer membrane beta-barrel protein [Thermodesulfobacteriota bacterium]|nr:outer membrane beta-barrel protein [Thermodesulfobacteriota bacterium]
MKKNFGAVLIILVSFFVFSSLCFAGTLGEPKTVGKNKFRVGIDYQYIFDKDMEYKSGAKASDTISDVEIDYLHRAFAKFSYGIVDNVEIYGLLGVADGEVKLKSLDTDPGGKLYNCDFDTDSTFAYGAGFKFSYSYDENWVLGIDAHYIRHKGDYSGKCAAGGDTSLSTGDMTFQEWQVMPSVGYKISKFTPYLGFGYTDMRIKVEENGGNTTKYEADDNVGVVCGVAYEPYKNLSFGVEGRFVDETAMSVMGFYAF